MILISFVFRSINLQIFFFYRSINLQILFFCNSFVFIWFFWSLVDLQFLVFLFFRVSIFSWSSHIGPEQKTTQRPRAEGYTSALRKAPTSHQHLGKRPHHIRFDLIPSHLYISHFTVYYFDSSMRSPMSFLWWPSSRRVCFTSHLTSHTAISHLTSPTAISSLSPLSNHMVFSVYHVFNHILELDLCACERIEKKMFCI